MAPWNPRHEDRRRPARQPFRLSNAYVANGENDTSWANHRDVDGAAEVRDWLDGPSLKNLLQRPASGWTATYHILALKLGLKPAHKVKKEDTERKDPTIKQGPDDSGKKARKNPFLGSVRTAPIRIADDDDDTLVLAVDSTNALGGEKGDTRHRVTPTAITPTDTLLRQHLDLLWLSQTFHRAQILENSNPCEDNSMSGYSSLPESLRKERRVYVCNGRLIQVAYESMQ